MFLRNRITAIISHLRTVLLISLLLISSFSITNGQKAKEDQFPYDQKETSDTPAFKERLFYGGSFGLQFGTITDIQISPVVGYWLLPRVAVAIGPTYRFYKDQLDKTNVYGGRGYVQFVVIQDLNSIVPLGSHTGIFLHAEDELLSLEASFWKYPLNPRGRFFVNTVLAGAGITQQLGKRSSINFMALWPLNDPTYDIYSKPELRISFIF
jgi:hypothetical protein